ncbi:MAG TPA: hypothetical protein DD738_11880 [Ruminiclostridium sp.]|nr:hypothetical protein [Ruminiclostridium sp.]
MRENFKSRTKRFLSAFLALSLIFTIFIGDSAWAYITDFASTHIFFNEEREIGKGVVLNNWQGRNPDGTPKLGHTITFNPKTSDAMVMTAFGNSINSRKTLSSTSYLVEQQGVTVLGGINGDFYHLANGVPIGIVIHEGKLISNSATDWNAIGFKADGSVVIGKPKITMKAIIDGTEYPFGNFNKAQGEWGPYLYSQEFGANTGSTVPSIEVILNIDEGEPAVGDTLVATVAEIRTNTKATPIGENQLVLSAQLNKTGHWALAQFKEGDIVAFQFTDATGQWNNVVQAIGGDKLLIDNGSVVSGLPTKNYNPSTAIGVKANGEVVLYECDGRTGASQGVSSYELAQFLYNLGCTKAIQLDGGGSSAILARMPGYRSPGLISRPSDGAERANSNAILLVSKRSVEIRDGAAQPGTIAEKVHIYPGKIYALQNATIEYKALATDEYFFPTALPEDMVWGSDAGTMDQSGKLTIDKGPGKYQVLAGGGKALGAAAEITVLSSVASLKPSKTKVTVSPGGSVDLSCTAYYQDVSAYANDSSFKWSVEGNIGSITQEGVFTAAQTPGTGRIAVSYGSVKAYIDVTFSDAPDSVEDFENGTLWGSSIIRAKSGTASIVQDAAMAKSGTKLLKVDYDFTLADGVEKGVAGAYAHRLDPATKQPAGIALEKDPTAIGMWVYGDNSKTWIRAKVKDGKGQSFDIDFTKDYRTDTMTGGVDWAGWKYVEAAIPEGREGPFILETPIRIMCTREEMRGKGTLYFDKITAVYGAGSKDMTAPSAKIISPANSAVFNAAKVPVNIELTDNSGGSGINVSSVKVLLDGAEVSGLSVSGSGSAAVKGELGAAILSDGMHKLVVNYSDAAGNTGSSAATFTVETGAPQIVVSTSPSYYAGGGAFTTDISVKNPKNLKKFYLVFSYNPSQVEFVDGDAQTPGKQAAFESWVKKGKLMNNGVNEANGKIILSVDNLTGLSSGTLSKIGTLTFKAKSDLRTATNVNFDFGAMLVANKSASLRFTLPSMAVNMEYGLALSVTGTAKNEPTTFSVTDKNGNPVAGASLTIDEVQKTVWTTDSAGKAYSTDITHLPVGASFTVTANKNGIISNTITFTVTEKNTELTPQKVSLSLTPDPGSISVNYVTPTDQVATFIQYAEKSSFTGAFSLAQQAKSSDSPVSLVNVSGTEPARVHMAILKGLKPGTDYVYRISNSSGKTSPVYEFTMPGYEEPYSFAFITDPQGASEEAYKVFGDVLGKAVEKAGNPAFVLLGGDLADRGGNLKQWNMFFDAGSRIFSSLPVMAAPGNHEYYDDANLINFKAFFNLPQNGPAGYEETAYSFQTKDALFMVLDTQKSLNPQLQWVEETSRASDKKWKIVMMHRGIYSGFYDEAELRKVIAPAFDRAGIDLVLNGHDHTYLRATMKAGNKVPLGEGTTYITGGSSGKKYYDAAERSWTSVLYDANNPVFSTFKIYSDRILVVASHVENGGTVDHDRFEIIKK